MAWNGVTNDLHSALDDYLSIRRSVGFKLDRTEKLLRQFLSELEANRADTITVDAAVSWATAPVNASLDWWGNRLSVVRTFARTSTRSTRSMKSRQRA